MEHPIRQTQGHREIGCAGASIERVTLIDGETINVKLILNDFLYLTGKLPNILVTFQICIHTYKTMLSANRVIVLMSGTVKEF